MPTGATRGGGGRENLPECTYIGLQAVCVKSLRENIQRPKSDQRIGEALWASLAGRRIRTRLANEKPPGFTGGRLVLF